MIRWDVVCCKPRQELLAQENLLRQGYHAYLPRIQTRQRRRDKWVNVVDALFPRYLFIQIDSAQQSTAPVRSTRGAVGLVRFGGQPAIVPDQVIVALMQREDEASGLHQDQRTLFNTGCAVKLVEGPLAGMEGIFSQQDGEERVVVLLELLGKSNKVVVNRDWVAQAA